MKINFMQNSFRFLILSLVCFGFVTSMAQQTSKIGKQGIVKANHTTPFSKFSPTHTNSSSIAPITGKDSFCVKTKITLSNSTIGGKWSSTDTLTAKVDSLSGLVTGIKSGNDTIWYVVPNGSGSFDSAFYPIVVVGLPIITPIIGLNSICSKTSDTLKSTPSGGTWFTTTPTKLLYTTNGIFKALAAGKGQAYYTVKNNFGCADTVNFTITVKATPTNLGTITAKSQYCFKGLDTLTESVVGGYWTTGNPAIFSIDSTTGILTPKGAGTTSVYYTVTNAAGCKDSINKSVTIAPPIIIPKIQSKKDSICMFSTFVLKNTLKPGVWKHSSPYNTFFVATADSATITAAQPGFDTVTYVYVDPVFGCTDSTSKIFTLNLSGCNCCPDNISFENGNFSNWLADNGTVSGSSNSVYTFTTVGPTPPLHRITSAATKPKLDPYGKFPVFYGGTGGKYSAKLNDTSSGGKAVRVAYTISIPPGQNQYVLEYYYAVVLEDPSHAPWEQPGFNVQVWDLGINPNNPKSIVLPCDTAHYTSTNVTGRPGWKTSTTTSQGGNPVKYCGWTPGALILKKLAGHNVRIDFVAHDCSLGGHWGYAYLDLDTLCSVNAVANFGGTQIVGSEYCKNIPTLTLTAPAGYKTYSWYDTTGFPKSPAIYIKNTNTLTYTPPPQKDTTLGKLILTPYKNFYCYDTIDVFLVGHNPPIVSPIIADTNICVGKTLILKDSTLADSISKIGGIWQTFANPLIGIANSGVSFGGVNKGLDTAILSGISPGVDSLQYLVVNKYGCKDSAKMNIHVNPIPIVSSINGPSISCTGKTLTFTNATPNGKWYSIDTSLATIDSLSGIAITKKAGNALIRYIVTNASGCQDSVSVALSIGDLTVAPIIGNTKVCAGLTDTFVNATANGVWSVTNPSIATISTNGVVSALQSGLDTVLYSVSNSFGCADTAFLYLTVNAFPHVSVISGKSQLCKGDTSQLSDTLVTGVWASSNPAVATISSNGLVTGLQAGNAIITFTGNNINQTGCYDSAAYPILVDPLPIIGAIAGNNQLCVGKLTTVLDSSVNGIWVSTNPLVASINNFGLVTGNTAGNTSIHYIVRTIAGCVDSVSFPLTVNALPAIPAITGSKDVCVGKNINLSNAVSGGTWLSYFTNIATIDNIGNVAGLISGVDTIRYIVTNLAGCTDSVYYLVTVHDLPIVAPITGVSGICLGNKTLLSDTTTGGVWKSVDPTIVTIDALGNYSGIKIGLASIRYIVTNAAGCTDSVSYSVTVNPIPIVGNITGLNAVCIGNSVTLNDTSLNGTWKSVLPNIASINTNGVVSALAVGVDTIRYIVSANGCSDSASFVLTVNGLPVIAPIAGLNQLCYGKNGYVTDATPNGIWLSTNTAVSTIDNSGYVVGLSVGNTTIRYIVKDNNGCIDSVAKILTVNTLPTITPIRGNTAVCVGKTTQLAESTYGGNWVIVNKDIASIDQTGLVNGTIAGVDTVRYIVTNFTGCTDSVFTLLTVNPLPIVGKITGDTAICIGTNTILEDSTKLGLWISTNMNVATINSIGFIRALAAGTTTIQFVTTNMYGCIDSVSTPFSVIAAPVIDAIKGNHTVCIGKQTWLTETTLNGIWKSDVDTIASVSSTGLVSGQAAGTTNIRYVVTNAIGCVDSVQFALTVNPSPMVAPIAGNTKICKSDYSYLTSATPTGTWQSSDPSVAPITFSGSVQGLSLGTALITYTITDGNGCVDSTSTSVLVKGYPIVNFSIPTSICLPSGLGYFTDSTILPTNPFPVRYTWSFGDPNDNTTSSTQNPVHKFTLPTPTTGVYPIKLSVAANGCVRDTTIIMSASIIHDQPITHFTVSPYPPIVCLDSSVTFTDASATANTIVKKSIWYFGDNIIDTSISETYKYGYAATYVATHAIIDQFNCKSNVDTTVVSIVAYPTINIGSDKYVLSGDSAVLSPKVYGDGNLTYLWTPDTYLNNDSILNPITKPSADITYTLTVRGKANCASSANLNVIVLDALGIPNTFSPNNDGVHDTWAIPALRKYPGVTVKVFNRYGQLVYNSIGYHNYWDGKYNGQPLAYGTYYYIISPKNGLKDITGSVTILR